MAKNKPSDSSSKDETKRPESVMVAYRDRLKILKQAQEYSAKGEVPKAVEKYSHYLGILATYYKVTEATLTPKVFDAQKDITEMLLISHAYWDLAKSYDRSPKLQKECIRCLGQFIQFTIGHKFQHVNAQMLKKFLKSNKVYNRKPFEQALNRINVESKACYIATYAFPNNNKGILDDLRAFKYILAKSEFGLRLIDIYYTYSSRFVSQLSIYPRAGKVIDIVFLKPILIILHKIIKKVI